MAKIKLEFEGFEEVIAKMTRLEGDVKGTTEKALKESHRVATANAERAIAPHRKTGRTEHTLQKQAKVEWSGTMASVDVGFDIHNGGLASIFLMYGTPRTKKDQALYNAFYGAATRKEIHAIQEEIFRDEIRKLGG